MNIEWKQYRIGEVADVTSSKRIFLSDYVLEGIPFYRSKEVIEKFNGNEISLELFIKSEQYENIKRKFGVPQKDDILLTSVGTIGVPYKVKQNEVFYFKDGNLTWIRKYKKEIDPAFLFQWIRSEIGQKTIQQNLIGSSQSALTIADIKKLKIQLPPRPTQQRIASILSAYDDLIEVNNHRIKLLEETARELYKEWFVRMRFPGYKKAKFVKGVPAGWTFDTCYSFAYVKGGGTPSTINPQYWEGEINFFTPTDHSDSFYIFETEKKITEKGLKNSSTKMFLKYSTFITARGTVGNICLAGNDMAMNQSCFGIVSHKPIDCFFTFLFTDEMIRYLKLVASGATFDAITLNTFKNYKAPIPNIELREKYFELASPMFFQIENLIQQNIQLRQIRDRLLPRLISGKLEVKTNNILKQTEQA